MIADGTDAAISFQGFAPWLPLPLDGDADGFLALVDELFADDPVPSEVKRASAEALAGVGARVAAQSGDDYLAIAAWVLLSDQGRRLDPLTLLTFGATRVEPGSTANDFLERMCSEVDLYQPPAVEDLRTASGDATLVRLRRHTADGPHLLLSEVVAVFWMSDTMDVAYVMSTTPIDDLVLAAEVADAVVPLARSATGLRSPATH
ncbi:MAG: hypothetical protein NTV28_08430 [Propionibacteriales bacterium]|nr:hypothetical protein [Propionibacteriales bacterium]